MHSENLLFFLKKKNPQSLKLLNLPTPGLFDPLARGSNPRVDFLRDDEFSPPRWSVKVFIPTTHTVHTRNYRVNYPRKTKKAKNYYFSVSSEPSSRETPPQSPVAAGRHPLSISKIIHSFIHSFHTSISKMTHRPASPPSSCVSCMKNDNQSKKFQYFCMYVCMYLCMYVCTAMAKTFANTFFECYWSLLSKKICLLICYWNKICLFEVFHVIWYY